jgi:hypothetical protein
MEKCIQGNYEKTPLSVNGKYSDKTSDIPTYKLNNPLGLNIRLIPTYKGYYKRDLREGNIIYIPYKWTYNVFNENPTDQHHTKYIKPYDVTPDTLTLYFSMDISEPFESECNVMENDEPKTLKLVFKPNHATTTTT